MQRGIAVASNLKIKQLLLFSHAGQSRSSITQQTRDVNPMLYYCWASVADGGPTVIQHWVNVSCLLVMRHEFVPLPRPRHVFHPIIFIKGTINSGHCPPNTICLPNVGSKAGQGSRRWPSLDPALGGCLVFGGRQSYACILRENNVCVLPLICYLWSSAQLHGQPPHYSLSRQRRYIEPELVLLF